MTEVVLGLGTNLGNRLDHLRRAVRALRARAPVLLIDAISGIYESDALVPAGAPPDWCRPYLNLALRARFAGSAADLLRLAKAVEVALGRRPGPRWAPREADVDILAFGEEVIAADGVTAPHAGLADRPFALLPLADVWPGWRFPAGSPLAGWSARAATDRWIGDESRVPLHTRRSGLCLSELVGIVNLTPDSFSDGGQWTDPAAAADHARALAEAGATAVDLGAESTRPGGRPIDQEEEWRRLEPVLSRLQSLRAAGVRISVDTRHPATARRALDAGADWINDVTGFADPAMREVLRAGGAELVAMHSLSIPPERTITLPLDAEPVGQILRWASERLADLEAAGIARERVIVDPGLGFGKTPDQNLALVRGMGALGGLGVRILAGHSRKSFLARWYRPAEPGATEPAARDLETAVLSAFLASRQVDYIRVHDVAWSARALRAWALAGPTASTG